MKEEKIKIVGVIVNKRPVGVSPDHPSIVATPKDNSVRKVFEEESEKLREYEEEEP